VGQALSAHLGIGRVWFARGRNGTSIQKIQALSGAGPWVSPTAGETRGLEQGPVLQCLLSEGCEPYRSKLKGNEIYESLGRRKRYGRPARTRSGLSKRRHGRVRKTRTFFSPRFDAVHPAVDLAFW